MNQLKKFIACIFVCILFIGNVSAAIYANEHSAVVVKVGYLNGYGITKDKSGSLSGYSYDYLQEISNYTGWQYEFISCEWDEGIRMLENGEIDLFGPLQKNKWREEVFDFPVRQIGVEYGTIYIPKNQKDVYYNDPSSLDGMRIATVDNNFYNQRLTEYCRKNQIHVDMVYSRATHYVDGLANGEFDAVVAGSIMDIPDTIVAAKISAEPSYYATTKGNSEIINGLNLALDEIFTNDVYYEAELYQKYFGNKSISKPAFTREESQYLDSSPTLRVACDPDASPMSYFNAETNSFEGIGIRLLIELCKGTGIQLEFIKTDNFEECLQRVASGEADLLLNYDRLSKQYNFSYTNPLIQIPAVIVGKDDTALLDKQDIGYYGDRTDLIERLDNAYPDNKFICYDTANKLMQAFNAGKEKYILVDYYLFDEISWNNPGYSYSMITTSLSFPLTIGLTGTDSRVRGIMNKLIQRLSPERATSIALSHSESIKNKVPLRRIFYEYSAYIIIFIVIIFIVIFLLYLLNAKRTKHMLKEIAFYDQLTGLPTMTKFRTDVTLRLKQARPGEYTLLYLDIDNFKYINDTFGYEAGDLALIGISDHFKEHSHLYELCGRISADNFMFLAKAQPQEAMRESFDKMNQVAHHLIDFLPQNYMISLSTGYYVIQDVHDDFSILLDNANYARKIGKGRQQNSITEYTAEMATEVRWRKEVTLHMEQALVEREFKVYFQPKYDLKTETLVGAEALVRWEHPIYGLLSPVHFIPLFEKNGFIRKLDYYMFEEVCRLLSVWQKAYETVPAISINLSRSHLYSPDLADDLLFMTNKYNISPSLIETELTETIMFENADTLIAIMKKIRSVGFSISIDDFGNGYSSLNLLTDLPANVLKIDKGFLDHATMANKGWIIIQKVIEMAQNLNMKTVAEGVESKEQAKMLREIGCDIAQGYYYAKPMPFEDFENLIGV